MSDNELEVLIVEDNPGDAFIIEEMLLEIGVEINIKIVEDGLEAVNLLKNSGNVVPDIVILDLNLPIMNGFEVLKLMKNADKLREMPVIVLTGSLRKEDEVKARGLGATDYCIKPATVEEMERMVICLGDHLRSSKNKRKMAGPGTSVNADLCIHLSRIEDQYIKTPFIEMLIKDHFDNGNWNLME